MTVAPLARTLDQELQALLRGASLECLVCGEFVQHVLGGIRCPECCADYGKAAGGSQLELDVRAV
jgi:Zn finger protein HypA/HybF involved in hydrogenase expression